MITYLNRKYDYLIRWDGYDTSRLNHWVAFGNSYEEIWRVTVDKEVNHFEDEESYMLSKIGKKSEDYWTEDGDYLEEKFYNDTSDIDMTDEDYHDLIKQCNGNAYYSEFTLENEGD